MRVDILVPEDYLGDVMGDINARRGRIEALAIFPASSPSGLLSHCHKCSVMHGLAFTLSGPGTFVMQTSHFEEIPKGIMETILKK